MSTMIATTFLVCLLCQCLGQVVWPEECLGQFHQENVCGKGLYLDPTTDECLGVPGGGDVISIFQQDIPRHPLGFTAHPNNTNYYMVCLRKLKILAKCPNNTHFNSTSKVCEQDKSIFINKNVNRKEDDGDKSNTNCTKIIILCPIDFQYSPLMGSCIPKEIISLLQHGTFHNTSNEEKLNQLCLKCLKPLDKIISELKNICFDKNNKEMCKFQWIVCNNCENKDISNNLKENESNKNVFINNVTYENFKTTTPYLFDVETSTPPYKFQKTDLNDNLNTIIPSETTINYDMSSFIPYLTTEPPQEELFDNKETINLFTTEPFSTSNENINQEFHSTSSGNEQFPTHNDLLSDNIIKTSKQEFNLSMTSSVNDTYINTINPRKDEFENFTTEYIATTNEEILSEFVTENTNEFITTIESGTTLSFTHDTSITTEINVDQILSSTIKNEFIDSINDYTEEIGTSNPSSDQNMISTTQETMTNTIFDEKLNNIDITKTESSSSSWDYFDNVKFDYLSTTMQSELYSFSTDNIFTTENINIEEITPNPIDNYLTPINSNSKDYIDTSTFEDFSISNEYLTTQQTTWNNLETTTEFSKEYEDKLNEFNINSNEPIIPETTQYPITDSTNDEKLITSNLKVMTPQWITEAYTDTNHEIITATETTQEWTTETIYDENFILTNQDETMFTNFEETTETWPLETIDVTTVQENNRLKELIIESTTEVYIEESEANTPEEGTTEFYSTENFTSITDAYETTSFELESSTCDCQTSENTTLGYRITLSSEVNISKLPNCTSVGYFRLENSCHIFYECQLDEKNQFKDPIFYKCPLPFPFNVALGICDHPENVPECAAFNGNFNSNCTSGGLYPIPDNPNRYYNCSEVNPGMFLRQIMSCPKGCVFNGVEKHCKVLENNSQKSSDTFSIVQIEHKI